MSSSDHLSCLDNVREGICPKSVKVLLNARIANMEEEAEYLQEDPLGKPLVQSRAVPSVGTSFNRFVNEI